MHRCPVRTWGCCMLPVMSAALLLATSDMTLQLVSWAANLSKLHAVCAGSLSTPSQQCYAAPPCSSGAGSPLPAGVCCSAACHHPAATSKLRIAPAGRHSLADTQQAVCRSLTLGGGGGACLNVVSRLLLHCAAMAYVHALHTAATECQCTADTLPLPSLGHSCHIWSLWC